MTVWSSQLRAIQLLLLLGALTVCFSTKNRFYIYDWPQFANRYANFTDRSHHTHGVEFPQWTHHHGAGRLLSKMDMEYKTSQFGLYKIMHERALIDSRRTLNPNEASTFIIPYDFGMDATFLESNGRMRKTFCPLSSEVKALLDQSSFFHRNHGHDHVLIVSVNQNMNYFFNAANCMKLLMTCWNCTKLSIDEYMFIAQDRKFELQNRGINWHAVPFPADYHYDETVSGADGEAHPAGEIATASDNKAAKHIKTHPKTLHASEGGDHLPPWERAHENRSVIVSFLGNPKKFSDISTAIRGALIVQCEKHAPDCSHGSYKHDSAFTQVHHKASPNLESRSAVFCLQPPGDMPTRKSVFDSILSGCIPVLFHPLTATFMYELHWNQTLWEEVAVHFDTVDENNDLIAQKVDFVEKLINLYRTDPALVARKRQLIRDYAYSLQYSLIYLSNATNSLRVSNRYPHATVGSGGGLRGSGTTGDGHDRHVFDAYDTTMNYVLGVHGGQLRHDRTSQYLRCDQIDGAGGVKLQTSDHCHRIPRDAKGRVVDPYHPPSVVSHLHKST